jgi:hypothetical protein
MLKICLLYGNLLVSILCYHFGDCDCYSLLGCDVMWFGTATKLHGSTSKMAVNFNHLDDGEHGERV